MQNIAHSVQKKSHFTRELRPLFDVKCVFWCAKTVTLHSGDSHFLSKKKHFFIQKAVTLHSGKVTLHSGIVNKTQFSPGGKYSSPEKKNHPGKKKGDPKKTTFKGKTRGHFEPLRALENGQNCYFTLGNCYFTLGNCYFTLGNCYFTLGRGYSQTAYFRAFTKGQKSQLPINSLLIAY